MTATSPDPCSDDREPYGRLAFGAHVGGLAEQEQPPWQDKPPAWEELSDSDRDFYMRIGAAVAAKAEVKLTEVRETVTTFLAHYGNSELPMFKVALDLAHGVQQVLDRKGPHDA